MSHLRRESNFTPRHVFVLISLMFESPSLIFFNGPMKREHPNNMYSVLLEWTVNKFSEHHTDSIVFKVLAALSELDPIT